MQPPQTRQQRRAAERKARKLARKAIRPLAASPDPSPVQSSTQTGVAPASTKHRFSPELEDEFSPELLSRATSIYEHFERKAAARRTTSSAESEPQKLTTPVPQISPKREIIPDAAATCPPARTRINRANAQHSTGPRTSAGKLASSRNSLKHGLAGPQLIINGEDRTAFDALLADLLDEHQRANVSEELLVHQIAQSWWLSQRALRFQNECFTAEGVDQKRLLLFLRYQTTHERAFHKALSTLILLKKDRGRGFVSQACTNAGLVPGFVSQHGAEPSCLNQFVSQNAPVPPVFHPLALKNQSSENQFEENAARRSALIKAAVQRPRPLCQHDYLGRFTCSFGPHAHNDERRSRLVKQRIRRTFDACTNVSSRFRSAAGSLWSFSTIRGDSYWNSQ